MKVAMVTPFPADPERVVGGVAGVARYLAPPLARTPDLELRIIAPGHPARRSLDWEGCRVEYLPAAPGPGFLSYWTLERRAIRAALADWGPDLVHFQAIAGWSLGCATPWLLTLHGLGERDVLHSALPLRRLRSRVIGRVEAAARRRARHLVSISPWLEETLGDQLRGRVTRIDNPIDERFFRVARRERPGRVVFVGRLTALKNLGALLEAVARLAPRHPELELHVAGDAAGEAYAETCRERVRGDPRLRDRVRFLGSLAVDGVCGLLAEAACLALPSLQEVAPLVVEEAMAAGVPVVASARGGTPHLLESERSGLLFDPERPDEIARQLERVLSDAALRRALSERGRAIAEERFRAERVAERTRDVYRAALGMGSGAGA